MVLLVWFWHDVHCHSILINILFLLCIVSSLSILLWVVPPPLITTKWPTRDPAAATTRSHQQSSQISHHQRQQNSPEPPPPHHQRQQNPNNSYDIITYMDLGSYFIYLLFSIVPLTFCIWFIIHPITVTAPMHGKWLYWAFNSDCIVLTLVGYGVVFLLQIDSKGIWAPSLNLHSSHR